MDKTAENLAKLLKEEGISINELSRRTGVPQPSITRTLNKTHKEPRSGIVDPIAKYFGITAAELRGSLKKPIEDGEPLIVSDPQEIELIAVYRGVTERGKAFLLEAARVTKETHPKQKKKNVL